MKLINNAPDRLVNEHDLTRAKSIPAVSLQAGRVRRAVEEAQDQLGLNDLLMEVWDD